MNRSSSIFLLFISVVFSCFWAIATASAPDNSEEVQKRNSLLKAEGKYLSKNNGSQNDNGNTTTIFTIKAGSYKEKEYAESESKRLNQMGFNSFVEPVLWKGKPWYVLKVGEFTSREEAKKTENKLREKAPGFKAYILRENSKQKKKGVNKKGVLVDQKKPVREKRKAGRKDSVKMSSISTNLKNGSKIPPKKVTDQKILSPESPQKKEESKLFYSIQMGSHKNQNYAESDFKRFKEMGFNSYVQKISHDGDTWYRVKVGDFPTRENAKVVQGKLAREIPEINSYIVEENPDSLREEINKNIFYTIQIGSHKNKKYAESDLKELKEMGFNAYVQTVLREGDTWHRLRLGDFSTREEALTAKGLLAQKIPEINSFVVEEKKEEGKGNIGTEEITGREEKIELETNPKTEEEVKNKERVLITPSVSKKIEAIDPEVTTEEAIGEEASQTSDQKEITGEDEKPAKGMQKVTLDFENADIKEVITALAEIVGINYIIDPKVRGTVNIHTSGEIPVEGVLPILETIFEINNVAAVKVGDIYKIIPIKDAQKQFLLPQTGDQADEIASSDRVMLQIVPLRYVSSQEMEKILKRFLGKGGDIVNYPERNILIIVDTAANMQKLLTLIDTIDLSIFDTMHVKFYELEESEAKDLAKELEDLFNALGIDSKQKKGGGGGEVVRFIPIERLNIILAVSSMPEIFTKVSEWIAKLDGVRDELEEQIFIYFVENAKAIDIGDIIKELYGDKKTDRDKKQPTSRTSRDRKTRTPVKKTTSRTGLSATTGEIKVVVDEVNNAVIVRATPQDYAQVLKTIKLLDIIPKQVLIEVLIAEVTLDKNTEFGVEWTFAEDYASLGGYKGVSRTGQNFNLGGLGLDLTQPVGASGFTYAFASEALEAFLRAYSRENEVKILSTPHILVADNTEAKIDVGEEVPIVTSEYTPTSVQANESFSRSIEYRDTGILLTVTPRINDKGLVTMEVNQEVSNVSEQRIEGIDSPIILKRQAETSLVVQDGRTIVIGGLIRDQKEVTQEGVPYLSRIPYLGMLFGYTKEIAKKTELLFLITPHVVQNLEEAELVTQEFKEKVKELIKLIGN